VGRASAIVEAHTRWRARRLARRRRALTTRQAEQSDLSVGSTLRAMLPQWMRNLAAGR
jgi:hypothetical protein